MTLDRQRAQIDLVTLLVPAVATSVWAGWKLLQAPSVDWGRDQTLDLWGWYVTVLVVPQVVQTVVGQVLFTRVSIRAGLRGLIMIVVWAHTLVLLSVVELGPVVFFPNYQAVIYLQVAPLALIRLAVRTVVKARARRVQRATAA